jgi:hypothetical protein
MSFFQDRTDYFEAIARLHSDIAHDNDADRVAFCRINNEEELSAAMVSRMHFPALVYHNAFGKMNTHDNSWLTNKFTNTIWILSKKDMGDEPKAEVIQQMNDEAFAIMQQIVARMWNEYQENHCAGPFRRLDFEEFSYRMIGPIESGVYGWELTFTDETEDSGLTYDETKWS